MQGTRISFKSKEDAIHFAEKQGIQYFFPGASFVDVALFDPRVGLLRVSFKPPCCVYVVHQSCSCSQAETVKRIPPKNYSENFVYKPHKLRIMRTK